MPSSNPFTQAYGQLHVHTNCTHCARALVHFSRVFLCHPYLHAYALGYGSFLAENYEEFIWVFVKNKNLDLHEIWTVYFLQFFKQDLKNQFIWTSSSWDRKILQTPYQNFKRQKGTWTGKSKTKNSVWLWISSIFRIGLMRVQFQVLWQRHDSDGEVWPSIKVYSTSR